MKAWEWMMIFKETWWNEKQKLQIDACKIFKEWAKKKTSTRRLRRNIFGEKSLKRAVPNRGNVN